MNKRYLLLLFLLLIPISYAEMLISPNGFTGSVYLNTEKTAQIPIPKDFVLKKVMQGTAWHRDKDEVFQSLDVDLKDSDTFYKKRIIDGKIIQYSITVGELKGIINEHCQTIKKMTNGWYEDNS